MDNSDVEKLLPINFYHYNSSLYYSKSNKEPGVLFYDLIMRRIVEDSPFDVKLEKLSNSKGVKSLRKYSKEPISLQILSKLLLETYQYGLTHPSAGGFYPIDVWVVAKNVTNLRNGTYYYNVSEHKLHHIKESLEDNYLSKINRFAYDSPVLFFMIANLQNIINKYGARAYRYSLIECGHIGQNLYRKSQDLGLGCCAIGGFYDSKIIKQLPLNKYSYPLMIYSFGIPDKV